MVDSIRAQVCFLPLDSDLALAGYVPATINGFKASNSIRYGSCGQPGRRICGHWVFCHDKLVITGVMTAPIKLRLTAFAMAIAVVALMIGGAARTTWHEARLLKEKFSTVQVESFQIADHFQAVILDLNGTLRRYETLRNPADWESFIRASEELDGWIDEQAARLKNPSEIQLLSRINDAYDVYRASAREMTNESQQASPAVSPHKLLDEVESESKQLLGLANKLADAHREVVGNLIAGTQRSLTLFQQLIFGLLILLLALGGWLAAVVYNEMIAPLRVKLVESHAIIERQEKLASLGVLAAGVAHEIRNPLTAIKARLFTLQKMLNPDSSEAEDAAVIGTEISRLERIVRDVLQFARPGDPKLATLAAEVPLREVQTLMATQLEENGIQLKLESVVDARIQADPRQLKQVLINLVQNAAESIEANGTIRLGARAGWQRLGGQTLSVVVLEVQDTGKGISPEVQKRLFDPFFSTKAAGTGLGLAISARIVEKHGGALEFRTQVNHGTTFGIILPQSKSK
jgi:signal transduction histidine kinase